MTSCHVCKPTSLIIGISIRMTPLTGDIHQK